MEAGQDKIATAIPVGDLAGIVDESGTVCVDRSCLKCGYNLRGLAHAGRCPECATPVGISIHGDLLCYAEPSYVSKLARGSRWIMRGLTTSLLCVVVSIGAGFTIAFSPFGAAATLLVGLFFLLLGLAMLAGGIMFLLGVWFMTTPEPRVFEADKRDTARRLVRTYMLVTILGIALGVIVEELGPPPRIMAAFELLSLGFSVLGVVGTAAYFLYLRSLARRISGPNDRGASYAGRAGWLARAFTVTLGLWVALEAVETIVAWGPVLASPNAPAPTPFPFAATAPATLGGSPWTMVRTCLGGILALVLLVLFLAAVRLHHRLRKALERQAELAAEFWRVAAQAGTVIAGDPADAQAPR